MGGRSSSFKKSGGSKPSVKDNNKIIKFPGAVQQKKLSAEAQKRKDQYVNSLSVYDNGDFDNLRKLTKDEIRKHVRILAYQSMQNDDYKGYNDLKQAIYMKHGVSRRDRERIMAPTKKAKTEQERRSMVNHITENYHWREKSANAKKEYHDTMVKYAKKTLKKHSDDQHFWMSK